MCRLEEQEAAKQSSPDSLGLVTVLFKNVPRSLTFYADGGDVVHSIKLDLVTWHISLDLQKVPFLGHAKMVTAGKALQRITIRLSRCYGRLGASQCIF